MTRRSNYIDQLGRLVQVGSGGESTNRMVRLVSVSAGNVYNARPVEFDETGQLQITGQSTLKVTNLAEPADVPGVLLSEVESLDVVAVDLAGRWVVSVRLGSPATFPARILSSQGQGSYSLREQSMASDGTFSDAVGAVDIIATNLAELQAGSGGPVAVETLVVVTSIIDTAQPATLRYFFNQPT